MKPLYYIPLSAGSFLLGIIFYCFYHEILVIKRVRYPNQQLNKHEVIKKKFLLYFWKDKAWHKEEKELISSSDKSQTLTYLINSWLGLLEEEKLLPHKSSLQSVMLDETGYELFVSFDCNPLKKDSSTYTKLMWVEGLLKTIRENQIPINAIRFLVRHKPLPDYHLDFSSAWPIIGYLCEPV